MKTLKRSECSVLPLFLKTKWFRMIERGEKWEEYRDATSFWETRIRNWAWPVRDGKKLVVAFSLGYRKPSMFFLAWPFPFTPEYPMLQAFFHHRKEGHPEWGEPAEGNWHYVIKLIERVELED